MKCLFMRRKGAKLIEASFRFKVNFVLTRSAYIRSGRSNQGQQRIGCEKSNVRDKACIIEMKESFFSDTVYIILLFHDYINISFHEKKINDLYYFKITFFVICSFTICYMYVEMRTVICINDFCRKSLICIINLQVKVDLIGITWLNGIGELEK